MLIVILPSSWILLEWCPQWFLRRSYFPSESKGHLSHHFLETKDVLEQSSIPYDGQHTMHWYFVRLRFLSIFGISARMTPIPTSFTWKYSIKVISTLDLFDNLDLALGHGYKVKISSGQSIPNIALTSVTTSIQMPTFTPYGGTCKTLHLCLQRTRGFNFFLSTSLSVMILQNHNIRIRGSRSIA